ncbi:hypothetical protein KFK09_024574 [Dendrobium nobile]|uniref:Mur ligase central domain-containing protein n=1 Tax=Dendrobium nobile TaxID=94219 RepID=A0A8T3ADG9_DENNO|nr:hypothetical protein KFK09_024574 [Dendrobium nobile]
MLEEEEKVAAALSDSPSFELDLESLGKSRNQILEPKFGMTLAELLDDSQVVPLPVYGNLEVLITEIQHDAKEVSSGDLFICCSGATTDGHDYLTEADKRGAVAVVADKVINLDETIGCKALVVVEDTNLVLSVLAASFYRNLSSTLSVIGITGTRGKTSTSYLVKAMYEAMELRTGMLGSLGHYIHGDNKLDASESTPDAVSIQKLMAKMVHNGTEVVVVEASSHGLAEGRCDEVDFDIVVFTNLTRDHKQLIYALCMENRLKDARKMFDSICQKGMVPNVVTFNFLIVGLCQKGKVDDAFVLVSSMEANPDSRTCNELIDGFFCEGKLHNGLRIDDGPIILVGNARTNQDIHDFVIGTYHSTYKLNGLKQLWDALVLESQLQRSSVKGDAYFVGSCFETFDILCGRTSAQIDYEEDANDENKIFDPGISFSYATISFSIMRLDGVEPFYARGE